MMRFDGQVALVTGGGRGLGRAHAHLLASRGCKLVVADAAQMVDVAFNRFGRLDILINNAGPLGSFRLFEDTSAESSERVADIHYKGTVALCRAAWPHLAASGAGRIINTSSAAILGSESQTDYGSAKAAIFGFTRSLAIEGRRHGINVNCILPSAFTRMMETISDPLVRDSARPIMGCHRSAESKDGGF